MKFEVSELGINLVPAHVDVVGLDEKIAQAELMLNELDAVEIDEHTEKYVTAKRAELNKFIKALSAERIANTKAVQGNWPPTANKIKSLEDRAKTTVEGLGVGLKALDNVRRDDKRKLVDKEIAKTAEQFNIEPTAITFDDKWLNKSYSWPQMQEEIVEQLEKVQMEREVLALQIESIESYAQKLNLQPDGYIGMLTNNIEPKVVRQQMDNDVKVRESRLQAQREREEQEAKAHAERLEKAQKVGDKMIDAESGEIIEEPPAEHEYLFKLKMTDDQYKQMLANFKKWGIYVADKKA